MPTDRYTKAVLTVIAAALVVLVVRNTTERATAQQPNTMCPMMSPCYVVNTQVSPLFVREFGADTTPREQYRGIPPSSGQPR